MEMYNAVVVVCVCVCGTVCGGGLCMGMYNGVVVVCVCMWDRVWWWAMHGNVQCCCSGLVEFECWGTCAYVRCTYNLD